MFFRRLNGSGKRRGRSICVEEIPRSTFIAGSERIKRVGKNAWQEPHMWNNPPLPTNRAEQKEIRNRFILLALAALIALVIHLIARQ